MATFVLVHGGWHGGWCWQKVIPFLEAAGHEVYAPTLTGLAERAAELSPDIGLDTHIRCRRLASGKESAWCHPGGSQLWWDGHHWRG